MAMKTITCNIAKAASALCLVSLTVSVTKAQEDRGERLQESTSASDQRTNFSARKAGPSKIDSAAFKDLVEKRKQCLAAQRKLARYLEKERRGEELSTSEKRNRDAAWAALKQAEAAVKAAERKANAD
jgi:hypothetical protein